VDAHNPVVERNMAARRTATGPPATLAAILVAAAILALPAIHLVLTANTPATVPAYDRSAAGIAGSGFIVPFLATAAIVWLLTQRAPRNPVGWLLGAMVICFLISTVSQDALYDALYGPGLPRPFLVALVLAAAAVPVAPLFIQLILVFPDGKLLSPRWRPLVWLNIALAVIGALASATDPAVMGDGHRNLVNPIALPHAGDVSAAVSLFSFVLLMGVLLMAAATLVLRYVRATSELRHQVKWFGAGVATLFLSFVVAFLTASSPAWNTLPPAIALMVGLTAPPVCIGVAVLKYRLYDIDIVISRALLYGSLGALISAVYVGIVVGVGSVIGTSGKANIGLSIAATAVVAVGFQPLRDRLQKVANRLVYGNRATPYEVLSEFSERAADSFAGDEVLPRMARVLAEATGAEITEVWLHSASALNRVANWPVDVTPREGVPVTGQILPVIAGRDRAFAVRHQGELLGALTVTKRKGEALSPVEEKLTEDLARQVGLVLKNVGLTADLKARLEDLRASRQRLVAAQDQERRRLERNLHDGAQQHLVAIKVKLGLLAVLSQKDPARAATILGELTNDADEALQTLRDLARGIYPPLLADSGLAAALSAQARKATLPVSVNAEGVGRYSQDVEAAVYFCCLEALQNVQKYAAAGAARVTVTRSDGGLRFEVSDDGKGFDSTSAQRGAGLQNMADRLDALGGEIAIESEPGRGTMIAGTIPAAALKAA
jgi:signal transduction histidine kinase